MGLSTALAWQPEAVLEASGAICCPSSLRGATCQYCGAWMPKPRGPLAQAPALPYFPAPPCKWTVYLWVRIQAGPAVPQLSALLG